MSEEITPTEEVVENPESEPAEQEQQKSNVQTRIDTITRQKYEAMQEVDIEKKKNKSLQDELDELRSKPAVEPEPELEDVDYDESAYNQAIINQSAEKVVKRILSERDSKIESDIQGQNDIESGKKYAALEAKFSNDVTDYDQVVKNPNLPINDSMANAIRSSENGPAIAYHLGKNIEQTYNIAQMNDYQINMEIAKIEMGLNKAADVSSAPAPIPGDIAGINSGENYSGLDDKLSTSEWMKRRNKQVHG